MKTLIIVPCEQGKIWDKIPTTGPTHAYDAYTGALDEFNGVNLLLAPILAFSFVRIYQFAFQYATCRLRSKPPNTPQCRHKDAKYTINVKA